MLTLSCVNTLVAQPMDGPWYERDMPTFRRKPTTVIAEQFLGSPINGVAWNQERPYVTTIHGQACYVEIGDWIVPEPDGVSYYPIKDEVFRSIYELV